MAVPGAEPARARSAASAILRGMIEAEIVQFVRGLAGVAVTVASEDNGAPEVAWGDSFFFYDPDGDLPDDRRSPFATIVTGD